MGLTDIELNLKDKRTPEGNIRVFEGLAEDRSKWRKVVKDIVAVNREICIDDDDLHIMTD